MTGDYRLICTPQAEEAGVRLAERMERRGKGRIALVQRLWCGDTLCLEAQATTPCYPSGAPDAGVARQSENRLAFADLSR